MENIVLNGTIKQQANQLWEILKIKELSADALQEIMPSCTAFYKELVQCINNEIISDKDIASTAIDAYKQSLSALSQGLTDKELSSDDKKIIADKISEMCHHIHEIEKDHSDKSTLSKNMMIFSGAAVLLIIGVLASKKLP